MYQKDFTKLEDILKINLCRRGMKNAFVTGELEKAARSLMNGDTVFITTGFVIRAAMAGETDGPIGAVSIAGALEELGKKVVFITDIYTENILKRCAGVRGVQAPIEIIDHGADVQFSRKLIKKYKPSHMIAIERPGNAKDGRRYSMRGEDLSDIVPDADVLFREARRQNITTIGIGDGGNEIGMGKIRAYIIDTVHKGEQISAAFASDYIIVAGVSNWGGHALAAALSVLGQRVLLHDIAAEALMLKSMVEAGAVDGCTKLRAMTVDGLSLEENLRIFMELADAVRPPVCQSCQLDSHLSINL